MNYADVTAGQLLIKLGDKDASADIASKQNSLREAQKGVDTAVKALEEAQKKLENYHATSPISGKVLSCSLIAGDPVSSGASIQIADTTTMVVDINIDERNVGYISTGMFVNLQDQMGNFYMGTVEQVSLTAKAENGVANFPATVAVDNPDGALMTGTYVDYSFVASQSDDCLVVPVQAVLNVTLPSDEGPVSEEEFTNGEALPAEPVADGRSPGAMGGASVGGDTATPDDRAIEADPSWQMPEGFFAVRVETGLSDESNVEIKSGLNEGDMVFTGYMTQSANNWG